MEPSTLHVLSEHWSGTWMEGLRDARLRWSNRNNMTTADAQLAAASLTCTVPKPARDHKRDYCTLFAAMAQETGVCVVSPVNAWTRGSHASATRAVRDLPEVDLNG